MIPNIPEANKEHCFYCFKVLQAKLNNEAIPQFPKTLQDVQVPIFVTWMIGEQLRGCIGTFSPDKLSKILSEYALIAALQDDRFGPIDLSQLPHLNVGVSLLVNFIPNLGAFDWQVGKNGIILELVRNGRKYSATFLPQVAQQQKWDKKTTLKHLLRKSGCNMPIDMVIDDIKITTYQSSKARATFEQFSKG